MNGTFTRKEISESYGISVENLKYREKALGIIPVFKKQKSKAMLYTVNQIEELVNFNRKVDEFPKIIYVTQTYLILPSRMNYDANL